MATATCAGWERLPHDVDESDINLVGSTKFCKDCYQVFKKDPMGDELAKYL